MVRLGLWLLFAVICVGQQMAVAKTDVARSEKAEASSWHSDYAVAYQQAWRQGKMLLIFFDDAATSESEQRFLARTPKRAEELTPGRYVFLRLPLTAEVMVDGALQPLAQHAAFGELRGGQGVAVVDFLNQGAAYYGHVVTCLPFGRGNAYDDYASDLILTLPNGTLTQRTMVFAVRMHPERPLSTHGQASSVLMEEAESHSQYQADITVQGHHDWEARFHRISARMNGEVSAKEVCAESWPNYSLVEACFDCVHSWRQSDGHWEAVRSRHAYYGYDIKRGRNGIWYATGIFGH